MRRFLLSAFSVAFYVYVTVFAVNLSQVLAGHPDQGKCCPLPVELEIKFVDVPLFREQADGSIYSDVISHYKENPFSGESRSTNAHETTHMINNVLRNAHTELFKKPFNGFYVLNGRGVVIEEPKIKKSFVNHFVPKNLRSYRWQGYFEEEKDWDDRPLYILDEWSCYIVGGKVCIDDVKNNRHVEKWHDGVSGCLDFSIYSLGLCMAIKRGDPEYWEKNVQFRSLVCLQLHESNATFLEGCKMEQFKSEKQDKLLKELLTSEEAEPYREMLRKYFHGVWLNESTITTSIIDTTYKAHQK
jgi:hypothetical protein